MLNAMMSRRKWLTLLTTGVFSLSALPLLAYGNETYQIEGYRSATFGMTEADLRKAIAKDFPKEAAKLKVESHPNELTQVMIVDVANLVENAGPAKISYVLGYKSKKLIQVNIVWGNAAVPESKATLDELKLASQNLIRYFGQFKFKEGSVTVNKQLNDGSVALFRAEDEKNRSLLLRLGGVPKNQPKDAKADAKPEALYFLRVSYVLDEANPDIYKIEKGAF